MTTSHLTNPAKDAGQVIGYSHSTGSPQNGNQVAGYAALRARSVLAYQQGMSRPSLIERLAIRPRPPAAKSLVICRALHLDLLATFLHWPGTQIIFALLLASSPLCSYAGAIEKLKTFISSTHSAQANFTQDVFDQTGKRIQRSSGIMQFQRPGKFRWSYQKPYEQLIVGDGEKFWLYDPDLNQVTVRKLDAALGSSPAALLSGNNEIERGFNLVEDVRRDNLDWLHATPKAQDSGFEKIRMAFDAKAGLVIMELFDTFGNKTVLKFTAMQRNPGIPEQEFHFTPPKGADVLSD